MQSQVVADALRQRPEDLGPLGARVGAGGRRRQLRPAVGVENDLAFLPGASAHPHAGLEQRELGGPGGEAARAAELVELGEHGHEGIVCGLHRNVVELVAAYVCERSSPARYLEPRRAEKQLVQ